jgi:uncharacterized protein YqeY
MSSPLRERLTAELSVAMKARDQPTVAAMRSALAAIANAEAADLPATSGTSQAIERSPKGARATEVSRKVLTEAEIQGLVRNEIDERTAAVADYRRAGRADRADRLALEAAALRKVARVEAGEG